MEDMRLRKKNSGKADRKLKKRKLNDKSHPVGIREDQMRGDNPMRKKKKKSHKGELLKQDNVLVQKNSKGQGKSSELDASASISGQSYFKDKRSNELEQDAEMLDSGKVKNSGLLKMQKQKNGVVGNMGRDDETKSKRAKKGKKGQSQLQKEAAENRAETMDYDVYQISSGDEDEDCCRGMNKWLTEYHQHRPGLKILQERIDDFITAYDEKEEQARKAREDEAAEGGWTVVGHHKGGKKSTDLESGISVGSVSQAAVMDKLSKKKEKIASNFYNFQRREAKRNELLMVRNKFEEDKKRMQQLRAARKFKPY